MFVFSLKAADIRKTALIALAAVLILTGAYFLFFRDSQDSESTVKAAISERAETAQERTAYISNFGHEVREDPIKVEEVIIPEEFDETYENYNEIQKSQGFDLSKYKGCRVKKWTYEVTNYKGYEGTEGIIEANLLIYDSLIIGADLQCLEQDGFIKPLFEKSEKS